MTQPFFNILNKKWGPFTTDWFADSTNAKVQRFFSKYACPNTSGVNAFLYSWAGGKNYLVPPVYMVGKVIKQLRYYNSYGVLVVPYWFSAAFWIYLRNVDGKFPPFVKDYILIDNPILCVKQGKNQNCFIGSKGFESRILALLLDFSQ